MGPIVRASGHPRLKLPKLSAVMDESFSIYCWNRNRDFPETRIESVTQQAMQTNDSFAGKRRVRPFSQAKGTQGGFNPKDRRPAEAGRVAQTFDSEKRVCERVERQHIMHGLHRDCSLNRLTSLRGRCGFDKSCGLVSDGITGTFPDYRADSAIPPQLLIDTSSLRTVQLMNWKTM